MNNLALNHQPTLLLVTRKTLLQAADQFMANAVGTYSQQDVFDAVAELADAANPKMLRDEMVWSVCPHCKRLAVPYWNHCDSHTFATHSCPHHGAVVPMKSAVVNAYPIPDWSAA